MDSSHISYLEIVIFVYNNALDVCIRGYTVSHITLLIVNKMFPKAVTGISY